MYINGQERFEVRKENHFRLEIPYKVHTRIPNNFIYVYSFCLKPNKINHQEVVISADLIVVN